MTEYTVKDWSIFTIYLIISLVAFLGNLFVLQVIINKKKLTNTYRLIANQCVSDGICGLIYMSLWFTCSTASLDTERGFFACEFILLIKVATIAVSGMTPCVIALDRYFSLYHPGKLSMRSNIWIPIIWILAFIAAFVNNLNFEVSEFFTPIRLIGCRVTFETDIEFFKKRFNYLFIIAIVISTLAVTIVAYYKIVRKFTETKPMTSEIESPADFALEKAKRNTVNMLITMTAFFTGLMAPFYTTLLIDTFYPIFPKPCNQATEPPIWWISVYVMLISSTLVNPFIMGYFQEEFGQEFKRMVSPLWRLTKIRIQFSISKEEEDKAKNGHANPTPSMRSTALDA